MDVRNRSNLWQTFICCISLILLQLNSPFVNADGTEALGTPSVKIASGTGVIAAGIGLEESQPGIINFTVPDGATVEQVLLYWHGYKDRPPGGLGDAEITVNGIAVTGVMIGGIVSLRSLDSTAYRADITKLRDKGKLLVSAGDNSLSIGGMDFSVNNGAGVLVIIDDNVSDPVHIDLRDGNDFAYNPLPIGKVAPPRDTTVAQTFDFAASANDRIAKLNMFFSSVSGTTSGGGFRPTAIEVTVGSTTTVFDNKLDSHDGQEWDTVTDSALVNVPVPAGETSVTVQALSVDNGVDFPVGVLHGQVASFHWIAAGLTVQPDRSGGRMTGGGRQINIDGARITRGFTIHCDITLSNNLEINWPGNKWHLSKPITSAACTDDPEVFQEPPAAPFDTLIGVGVGKLNGVEGAIVKFVFVDAGEPGRDDEASIRIWAPGADLSMDDPVLEVSGLLDNGNIQAHYDQPHK